MHYTLTWCIDRCIDAVSTAFQYARAYVDLLRGKPWED